MYMIHMTYIHHHNVEREERRKRKKLKRGYASYQKAVAGWLEYA